MASQPSFSDLVIGSHDSGEGTGCDVLLADLSPQAQALLHAALSFGEPQLPDGGDYGQSSLNTAAEGFRLSVLEKPR